MKHIKAACDALVTHIQGTTWTDTSVASGDIYWSWHGVKDIEDLATPHIVVTPIERTNTNLTRKSWEERASIACHVIQQMTGIDEDVANDLVGIADDLLLRVHKVTQGAGAFVSAVNTPIMDSEQVQNRLLAHSVVAIEYAFFIGD